MNNVMWEYFENEFERAARAIVEDEFERLRAVPAHIGKIEIPHIGGSYNPRDPQPDQVALVIRAFAAQNWFDKMDGPSRAPQLPLRIDAIRAMIDHTGPWFSATGQYAWQLREAGWHIRRQPSFNEFCAQPRELLARIRPPPPEPLVPLRRVGHLALVQSDCRADQ